ncbi:MAG: nucleotidyltransferase family protein [Candidatus Acidiferrum sp.]|jgi:hypothetical protein
MADKLTPRATADARRENSREWLALCACAKYPPDAATISETFRAIDWTALLALAEDHGVTQLLATAVRNLPTEGVPSGIRATLAERRRTQHFLTLRMSAELFRLAERFKRQNIGMLVVKGPALAVQAYGDAAMRNYGDLDFLVRHEEIARATNLMINAGYTPQIPLSAIAAGRVPGQYMFRQPEAKLLVELHNDRTMRYYPRPLPIEKLFERSVRVELDGREVAVPAVEDHLLLICIHGAKHFWERLMWIADVAALIARHPEIDWAGALQAARAVGAETMLHGGLLLASGVLQTHIPREVLAQANSNGAACAMTAQTLRWLPTAGETPPGLLERGLFRMRMRGGVAPGAGYFLRLLFSPTEEDWDANAKQPQRRLFDALKRPFRLAKKHGEGGKD